MNKKWMSFLLVLCMVLCLVPTTAFAENIETDAKTSVYAKANDLNITKRVSNNGDGTYDLVMEAFATGTSQVTTVSKPLDIVLVLDVSGSMDDSTTTRTYKAQDSRDYSYSSIDDSRTQYYYKDNNGQYYPVYADYDWHLFRSTEYYLYYRIGNRNYPIGNTVTSREQTIYTGVLYIATSTTAKKLDSMKNAAKNFVNTVASDAVATNVDHRISVVKFSGSKSERIGNDFYYKKGNKYNCSQTVAGLTDVKTDAAVLNNKIDTLYATGATRADFGMELANKLLSNTTADRQKVVVLFTDGVPTDYTEFDPDIANSAISAAKSMKDSGAVVYTVGMIADPSQDVQDFLDYTSSNYPNAKNMRNPGSKIAEGDYSVIVNDGSGLDDVFQKIASEAVSSSAAANESSLLTDTLSSYFNFKLTDDNKLAKCTVQKVSCTGENTWGMPEDITDQVTVNFNGKDMQVSGYNYTDEENLVVKKSDGSWQGHKLVLTFSVEPDPNAEWQPGTHNYPTNNTDSSKAGIYASDSSEILALTESPEVPMTAAKVTYQVDGDVPATFSAIPVDKVYLAGTSVSVADSLTTTETTKDGKTGIWTFNGWDKSDDFTMPTTDVAITGTWSFKYTENTNVTMVKVWNDDNDRDGVRPESIDVQLLDSDNNAIGGPVTLRADNANDDGNWSYTWNVPKYDANGSEKSYHVAEVSSDNNYTSVAEGMTITNTHEVSAVDVTMTKIWDDDNNRDGVRPESIDVQLYADDVPYGNVVKVKADGNGAWAYTWNGLYANNNGKPITYTVKEVNVDEDYTPSYSENTLTVTNRHTAATTDKTATKVWDDDNNRDGVRPDTVTVNLLANGKVVNSAELNRENQWTYTWENLYVNESGKPITYTVEEIDVAESYEAKVDGMVVTNIYKPMTADKTVKKIWDDADNHDGIRPDTVTVNLLANGKVVNKAELNSENQWTYTWEDLYVNEDGKSIDYTVEEININENYTASYSVSQNGTLTVTNTHVPFETYTVTYTDGVDDEEVFKDQVTGDLKAGSKTPAFNGTPVRYGYKFAGWSPAVTDTVTGNVTYTAQWEKVTPAEKYTVTYTDGVDNEEIFEDQTYTVEAGKATPAFNGTPTRKGYTFTGWKPAVAATVTGNATYEATWKSNTTTTTPNDNKPGTGETTSPKTGDTSNMLLWIALLFVSGGAAIGTTVVSKKKKYNR